MNKFIGDKDKKQFGSICNAGRQADREEDSSKVLLKLKVVLTIENLIMIKFVFFFQMISYGALENHLKAQNRRYALCVPGQLMASL